MNKHLVLYFLILTLTTPLAFANKKSANSVLPELKIDSNNEDVNQKKSVQGEVLVTKSETQAINVLIGILKKRKGTPQEGELWYRLAELYMRRAKTGRFFDIHRGLEGPVRFAPPEISSETAIDNLKRAIQVYTKIEREFPKFHEMDSVLFNNAFASQQIGLRKNAEALYLKVVNQHKRSPLVPDAHLALGEMKYDAQSFEEALEHFQTIEKFPQARVYSYGMYKAAWTLYNLHQTDRAINKLKQVVKYHDPDNQIARRVNHNLRGEALRDLAIFFGDAMPADKAYKFFAEITTEEELGEAMFNLGKLYLSHSRHKEMNQFLPEYIKRHPTGLQRIKMQILLVESNDALKDRTVTLKHLADLSSICQPSSVWAQANTATYDQDCNYDGARAKVEIAKKWWDQWLRNKTQKDLAEDTQQAFRIHLEKEDPSKPDTKSRYAFAELLFQVEKFREASEQYELVGKLTQDTTIRHDSNYAALVALQKASELKKQNNDKFELVRLSENYLQHHSDGPHATQVKFKLGYLAYEDGQHDQAEKWLMPIAKDNKAGDLKRKSEDLVLDILNSRKDYTALKVLSSELLKQSNADDRQQSLTKIMQESNYAEIQEIANSGESLKAAEELVSFHKNNKNSPLAKDSLWQALSLYYSNHKHIDGSFLALEYAQHYPDDKRTLDALKDAAKYFAESGLLVEAARTMETLALKSPEEADSYIEAASELYLLEGRKKETQNLLKKLLAKNNIKNQGKLVSRLMETMKGEENSKEYKELEAKIVSQGLEPYASEIRVTRVEKLLEDKKWTDAFNAAKPLVSTDSKAPADIRARARLVQAKVLEKEFLEARTKTTVERLALVLQIKTEKLDKAQTAFLTSSKIAEDPQIKLEALHGLNRIYTNYVDTVGKPILRDEDSLSEEDKKMLYTELGKLVAPISDKKVDTDKQLQELAKVSKAVAQKEQTGFSDLPTEETVKPSISMISADRFQTYLPAQRAPAAVVTRYSPSRADKCEFKDSKQHTVYALMDAINPCIQQRNWKTAERLAVEIAKSDSRLPWGNFYLSLIASNTGHHEKALYLVEQALKKEPSMPIAIYQRGRSHYFLKDLAKANTDFITSSALGLKTSETSLMNGVVSFAQGDCLSVVGEFDKLDKRLISELNLAPAIAECYAQTGEFDKSTNYIESIVKGYSKPLDLWLQLARIHEIFRFDSAKALSAYELAAQVAKDADAKEWLNRKIQLLRQQVVPTKVGEFKAEGDRP